MQEELAREKELLLLPGMQRPYFMEYRLEDLQSYEALANYGALTREEQSHQRVVRVTVRIGDYATDSSSARGDGSLQLAPDDNDADALKFALWTATDEAYKNALRAYATKQATLKHFQTAPTADDFTPAKAVTNIEPLAKLDIDRTEWKRRLVEASGLYASAPEVKSFAADVQYSTANLRGLVINRYTVNTDGAVLRHGYSGYTANISVGGQAADGMQLGRENGTTAETAAGLEDWPKFRERAIKNLKSFDELRNAPVVDAEDYHGPVLFSRRRGGGCDQPSICAEHRSRPAGDWNDRAYAGSVSVELSQPRSAGVSECRRRSFDAHVQGQVVARIVCGGR